MTAASGDSYTVGSTSEQSAAYDAMFDISYLGPIRARDLAGRQGEAVIQFFDFPLENGKTWSTTWDGIQVNLTATYAPTLPGAGGNQPGFAIQGEAFGAPYVAYDYSPSLKWWTKLLFAEGYGFTVQRATHNWTGTLVTAEAKALMDSTTAFPVVTLNSQTFKVDEGQTRVVLSLSGGSSAYARALALVDPAGQPYMTTTSNADAAPQGGGFFHTEDLPPTPGEWKISSPVVHEQDGFFRVTVHEVLVTGKAFP